MGLDVSPTKEIKGLTIQGAVRAIFISAVVIVTYANINNSITNLSETTKDLKQTVKETQQQNEVQFRLITNQLREQEIRLTRLEASKNK